MKRVKIETMAFGGRGLGHLDTKVIFVPGTLPGEEVSVDIVAERRSYLEGRVKEILTPSPLRVYPPCPYFGACGGCQWQHIVPEAQGGFKREILIDLLRRIGGLREIPPLSLAPSPQPFGYRIRIQLKVEGHRIGFFASRSRRIVEIERCLIAHPLINLILLQLRERTDLLSGTEEIEINVSPDEEKGILILHDPSLSPRRKPSLGELLQSIPLLKGIAQTKERGWEFFGDPFLYLILPLAGNEWMRQFRFRVSPGSFYQVNPYQNLELIHSVLDLGELRRDGRVLDLYAGIGNFTLPLATVGNWAIGIEENAGAVADARYNALVNRVENCRFYPGRVEEKLGEVGKGWNLIVLDPPRAGGKKVVDEVVRLEPERIVYVSCDPATFSRDVHLLMKGGYALDHLRLIDMFPQTYHMEVVGLLARKV